MSLVELGDARDPEETKAFGDLGLQQLEHTDDAFAAGGDQTVAVDATDPDHVGAERQRLDDVSAAVEAAVDDHLGAARNGRYHLGQNINRAATVVELPPTVVRDVDAFHALLTREVGILAGADALEDQSHPEFVADAPYVAPAERRLKLHAGWAPGAAAPAPRLSISLGDVALAAAVDRTIHGDAEGVVSEIHRLADLLIHPRSITACVELEDLRAGGGLTHLLHPCIRHRAQDEGNAETGRRTCHRDAAVFRERPQGRRWARAQ